MFDRREILKLGAAATAGTGLVAGRTGAQDDETPEGTPEETPTGTPTGPPLETLTGDVYAIARMTGEGQDPAVDTQARGATVFTVEDDGSIGYDFYVANIENMTMAHIHLAPEGESGPVVQWLYPSAEATEPELIEGNLWGLPVSDTITGENLTGPLEGESLEALVSEIEAGEAYVNVHTEQNPEGEIRGQIRVVTDAPTPAETVTPDETPEDTPDGTPEGTPEETPEGTPEETPTPGDETPTPTPEE